MLCQLVIEKRIRSEYKADAKVIRSQCKAKHKQISIPRHRFGQLADILNTTSVLYLGAWRIRTQDLETQNAIFRGFATSLEVLLGIFRDRF
jgi:hypothetical protein